MNGSRPHVALPALVLGACLTLVGCTESDGIGTAAAPLTATGVSGTDGVQGPTPADDGAPVAPNFAFAVGESYRNDRATPVEFVARLERFFEGALAPLQRLPGLMPRTVSVVYDRCGSANAFHDGATATITLCHELSEYAYGLFVGDAGANPDDPQAELESATSYVLAAMAFTLYHEIGHALDAQLDLPIAGNEESAVDAIATVIAVETGQFYYAVAGAALFSEQPTSLAGVHANGEDRAGDIYCWTVGGEPAAGAPLADSQITDIFAAVGRDCATEYLGQRDTVRSWVPGLARLNGDVPDAPSDIGIGESDFRVTLAPRWLEGTGSDPATRARVERLLADRIAPLGDAVGGLTAPVDVVYDECGASTSSYDAGTRTITLCDELVAHAYEVLTVDDVPESVAESAYVLQLAYDQLGSALYHEIGHVVHALGRVPGTWGVESAADAVAAVLLIETGDAMTAFFSALVLFSQSAEQAMLHGDAGERASDVLCLAFGGDVALRERASDTLLERYVTGDRDCVAEYAERRDEVRAWLSSDAGGA